MPLTEEERDQLDAQTALADQSYADAISAAVGERVFSNNHRFTDLRPLAWSNYSVTASGLAVSRYYFSARPPVVVDIVAQPARAKNEISAKRAYCKARGIRYVLIPDAYDDEGVRAQLAELARPAPASGTPRRPVAQKRPKTSTRAPRREPLKGATA